MDTLHTPEVGCPVKSLDDMAKDCASGLLEHFEKVISGEEPSICVVIVLGTHDKIHEYWLAGLGLSPNDFPVNEPEFVVNAKGVPVKCSVFSHPDGEPHTLLYRTTEPSSVLDSV